MGGTYGTLIACCEDRVLKTLLRGAAADSGLDFCPVVGVGEVRSLLAISTPALLVVGVGEISQEHLALVRDAYDEFKVPIILVAERPHDSAAADAIRSGAIACLGPKEAMQTLVFLVENVAANLLRGTQSRYASKRVLVVSDRVTLTVPDHCMTDGQYETRLPLIPGALLERLASHPNELVVFSDLIRAAWGRAEDASVNALHQQICRLREMLSEYGISARLQSMRGRGYMLRVPESRSGLRDRSGKDP